MRQRFDGFKPACLYAESESKKGGSKIYVTKTNSGGLYYMAVTAILISARDVTVFNEGEKILGVYEKGIKIK